MGIFDSAVKVANPYALGAFVLAAVVAVVYLLTRQRATKTALWPAWALLALFIVVSAWVLVKLGGGSNEASQPGDYEVVVTVKNPKGVFQNDPIIHCIPPTDQSQDVMSATCKYAPERVPADRKVTVIVDAGGGLQGSGDVELPAKFGIVTTDIQLAAALMEVASEKPAGTVPQAEAREKRARIPVTGGSAVAPEPGIHWYTSRDEWARHVVPIALPVNQLSSRQLKTLAEQGVLAFPDAGVTLRGEAAFGLSGLGLVPRNAAFVKPWSGKDVLESAKTQVTAEFTGGVKGFGCDLMSSLMALAGNQEETYQAVAKTSAGQQAPAMKDWKNPKVAAFLGVVSDQPLSSVQFQSKLSFLMVGSCAAGR